MKIVYRQTFGKFSRKFGSKNFVGLCARLIENLDCDVVVCWFVVFLNRPVFLVSSVGFSETATTQSCCCYYFCGYWLPLVCWSCHLKLDAAAVVVAAIFICGLLSVYLSHFMVAFLSLPLG